MSDRTPRKPALSRELVEAMLPPPAGAAGLTIQITIGAIHITVCAGDASCRPAPPKTPER